MKKTLTSLFCLWLIGSQLQGINYTVNKTSNWLFLAPQTPTIELVLHNETTEVTAETVQLQVATDQYTPLFLFTQQVQVPANDSLLVTFQFPLEPGFYRCTTHVTGAEDQKFNIGFEPQYLVSLCDAQPDFDAFWAKALQDLSAVDPQYKMTLLPEKSGKLRQVYLVEMKSLEGETICGYYAVPVKKGQYPAIINYMGYGSEPWCMEADGNPDFVEFILSVRGQGLYKATNTYGDWITYNLGNKDKYYYRGAFMDLVRAIDFVASRPQVDKRYIFAEGGSQGGAFSLAAAALDTRLAGIAPTIPFLSDYPDYFKIVSWPASAVLGKQKEIGLSDKDLYQMLSYFDIKNLAPRIKCPVIMGFGLQDEVCPPHTNFAGFNRINTRKQYEVFTLKGHDVTPEWWNIRMHFFQSIIHP